MYTTALIKRKGKEVEERKQNDPTQHDKERRAAKSLTLDLSLDLACFPQAA